MPLPKVVFHATEILSMSVCLKNRNDPNLPVNYPANAPTRNVSMRPAE
jgi:hypothetical protein